MIRIHGRSVRAARSFGCNTPCSFDLLFVSRVLMEGTEALKLQIEEYSHCRSREGKEVHWVYISDEETDREFVLETSRNWKISDLKIVFWSGFP